MAELRLGGLLYLQCTGVKGTLVTKTFVCEGQSLFVNADATLGELKVEVLSQAGDVLAVSKTILDDGVSVPVLFEGMPDTASWREQALQLRFTMVGPIKLYGFQWR